MHLCRICGASEEARVIEGVKLILEFDRLCHTCYFWLNNAYHNAFLSRWPVVFERDGTRHHATYTPVCLSLSDFAETTVEYTCPAYGMAITHPVRVTKLYFQGEIPLRFYPLFPVNAILHPGSWQPTPPEPER